MYARMGGGSQLVRNHDGSVTGLAGAYQYRIGGNVLNLTFAQNVWIDFSDSNWFKADYTATALPTYLMQGDSGSAIWGYDKIAQKWVVVGTGVFNSYGADGSTATGAWYRSALMPIKPYRGKLKIQKMTVYPNWAQAACTFREQAKIWVALAWVMAQFCSTNAPIRQAKNKRLTSWAL